MRTLWFLLVALSLGGCHRHAGWCPTCNDWLSCTYAGPGSISAPVWALMADSVVGRVESPPGAAVPGASVLLTPQRPITAERLHWTLTNNRGGFALRGLRPGVFALRVEQVGLMPLHRQVELKESGSLDSLVVVLSCSG